MKISKMSSCIVTQDDHRYQQLRPLQDSCFPFLHHDSNSRSPRNPSAALPGSAKNNPSSSSSSPSSSSCISVSGTVPLLKRKRPPSLQIPEASRALCTLMPSARDSRVNDKSAVAYNAAGCAVFSKKGKMKEVMEDTHKIVSGYRRDPKKGFFGVYDGHGGRNAAEYVAEILHKHVLGMTEKCSDLSKVEATKSAYLRTDKEFLDKGLTSGACCVTALIEDGEIIVSHVGDCRAVICRGGVAEVLTCDHRASREDEQARIEAQGGYVDIHHGTWRVGGVLAVTRSIGDLHLKEWVLAEPDSKRLAITADMEHLILASDGLWEKVDNQEAVDTVISNLWSIKNTSKEYDEQKSENIGPPLKIITSNQHGIKTQRLNQENLNPNHPPPKGGLLGACKELAGLAAKRGNLDDITVMIIDLKHFICN